jgi:hypothetical protein
MRREAQRPLWVPNIGVSSVACHELEAVVVDGPDGGRWQFTPTETGEYYAEYNMCTVQNANAKKERTSTNWNPDKCVVLFFAIFGFQTGGQRIEKTNWPQRRISNCENCSGTFFVLHKKRLFEDIVRLAQKTSARAPVGCAL